jgi:hypothetical protein
MVYPCRSENRMIREVFDTRERVFGGGCVLSGERPEDRSFENRTLLSVSEIPKVGRTKKLGKGGEDLLG